MLANAGLRVLITTHSPYMLDHLANLIRIATYDEQKQAELVERFFLKRTDAFIKQDDVSLYLVDQGKTENILEEDGLINWNTFGDVSDEVARIHYEL